MPRGSVDPYRDGDLGTILLTFHAFWTIDLTRNSFVDHVGRCKFEIVEREWVHYLFITIISRLNACCHYPP